MGLHALLHLQGGNNPQASNNVSSVRLEVVTAVTMQNGVFWDDSDARCEEISSQTASVASYSECCS
jgi:hypothetical protein